MSPFSRDMLSEYAALMSQVMQGHRSDLLEAAHYTHTG